MSERINQIAGRTSARYEPDAGMTAERKQIHLAAHFPGVPGVPPPAADRVLHRDRPSRMIVSSSPGRGGRLLPSSVP